MGDLVDLHVHSNRSCDGDVEPADLIRMAGELGFRAISISDHDTVAAYPEASVVGREENVEIIPSVEFTTLFDGREFHVLLPFVDWENESVAELVDRATRSRLSEAQARILKLREAGFDISWEEVQSETGAIPPLGVRIAQILLEKAARTGKKDGPPLKKYFEGRNLMLAPYLFYRDYFVEGKEAYVPKQHIPAFEVLEIAPRTGGVPVLSHPGAYFQRATSDDLACLKEKGLEGLEVYTSYHDRDQAEFYLSLAQEFDLVPTAGSDFHGRIKPHIPFGFVRDGGYWMVEALSKRRSR